VRESSRCFRVLLCLAVTVASLAAWVACCVPVLGEQLAAPDAVKQLTIIHTNDLHGHLLPTPGTGGGMAYVAGYVDQVREEVGEENVLLLDGGDTFWGHGISNNCPQGFGYSVVDIYNRMGYDAAAIGNHEFENRSGFEKCVEWSEFPWLAADVTVSGSQEHPDWVRPYTVVPVGDPGSEVAVGIIGISNKDYAPERGLGGLDFGDPSQAILRYYDEVMTQSDVLLVLAHRPPDEERGFKGLRTIAQELLAAGKPVDLMIGGHTHIRNYEVVEGTDTVIVEAYCYAECVGRLDVTVDPSAQKLVVSSHKLTEVNDSELKADPEIMTRVAYWADKAQLGGEGNLTPLLILYGVVGVLILSGVGVVIVRRRAAAGKESQQADVTDD